MKGRKRRSKMYLTKETVTLVADSTGTTGASQYTEHAFNGEFVGITYRPTTDADTILSTTAYIGLSVEGTTDRYIWYRLVATTDIWHAYPRHTLVDSTGVVMGVTTDSPVERFPLANERIRIDVTNSSAVLLTGFLDIYVEGA